MVAAGFKTILLEKEHLPRHKPCAGYISATAWDVATARFGQPPADVLAEPGRMAGWIVSGDGLAPCTFDLPVPGYVVKRPVFDAWLAASSGATLADGCNVTGVQLERYHVTLECSLTGSAGGEPEEAQVEATQLVVADGATSGLLSLIRPEFYRSRTRRHLAELMVFHLAADLDWDPAYQGLCFVRGMHGPARLWKQGDVFKVGLRYPRGKGWETELERLLAHLERQFGLASPEIQSREQAHINLGGVSGEVSFGAGSAVLAGEACGLLDGLGNGIYPALLSGALAGASLTEGMGERVTPHLHYQSLIVPIAEELRREHSRSHGLVGGIRTQELCADAGGLARRRFISLMHSQLRAV
ncbi:MAG: NAD(P)/FAD-dependent oxidoreductase [Candidatus Geothermincolia bacterium]